MSRQSLKSRKALRSAAAHKGWVTRRAVKVPYLPPFVMIHPACGKPAFGLTERPHYGALGDSSIIRHLDGRPMKRNSLMVCESCGGSIGVPQSANVVAWPPLKPATVPARVGAEHWMLPAARATDPNPWPRIAAAIRRAWHGFWGWFR